MCYEAVGVGWGVQMTATAFTEGTAAKRLPAAGSLLLKRLSAIKFTLELATKARGWGGGGGRVKLALLFLQPRG